MGAGQRLGVFGGTFDPPHVAHLALARAARDALALDEVRFVVTGQSWQKAHVTPAEHRAAMVALAIADEPRFVLDRREIDRGGPSYTIDTLDALRREVGDDATIALLLGSDQYRNLATWHRGERLLDLANIAVARRAADRVALPPIAPLRATQGQTVAFEMPALDVSASAIRAALHAPDAARIEPAVVPPAVLAYIRSHGLYPSHA